MQNLRLKPTRREDGAAVVEMAMVLSLLVLLVFGIIEFGRAYNAQVTLTHATREGVRTLAVTGDRDAAVDATYKAASSTLHPDFLSVTASNCDPGQPTNVQATYQMGISVPFFGERTLSLNSTAVMRCGG
jgi:Flp pilus assembly protein TadG